MNTPHDTNAFTFDPEAARRWLTRGDDTGTVAEELGVCDGWASPDSFDAAAIRTLADLLGEAPSNVLGRLDGYSLTVEAVDDPDDVRYRLIIGGPGSVRRAGRMGWAVDLFKAVDHDPWAAAEIELAIAAVGRLVKEANAELRDQVIPGGPVRLVLDLSTAHLPEDVCRDLNSYEGVVAYPLTSKSGIDYGWLLWVPDDPDAHVTEYRVDAGPGDPHDGDSYEWPPSEVLTIWRYARRRGCDYIILDRDAPTVGDLPTWDW